MISISVNSLDNYSLKGKLVKNHKLILVQDGDTGAPELTSSHNTLNIQLNRKQVPLIEIQKLAE